MQPGDLLDLDVTGVAHGGVFVARHEGRVVFVSDAIPGERVRARLSDTAKSSFWRTETVELLDASPHRRPHVWAAADVAVEPDGRPGGADFGHIALDHQRELKQRVLLEALERFGGLAQPAVTLAGATPVLAPDGTVLAEETPDATRWRTRVSLHVDADGRVGPFAARSHRVIPVDDLPLATAEIEDAARALSRATDHAPGRIDLVQPADGRVRVIPRPEPARRGAANRHGAGPRRGKRSRGRTAASGPAAHAPAPHTPTPHDPAREVVLERVGDRSFRVDAGGFWQVHRLAAHSLSALVADALADIGVDPDGHHLDLYGGVGLFAAALADAGGPATRVTSVESDARATEHAGENLAAWVGARAETDRTERYLTRLLAQAGAAERARLAHGVVLLDPPRSGAGREVVERVAALSPASVVYVACDPVALARDIGTFRALGYEPERIDALDLFPHSHHLEAVAVLSRDGHAR
ncbi:TRAM domain-containing protein [Microbacterium sp.]|uniref:class I SAM-dependent RNA methyltransferase n=1 Tax=Microbacterium sp. TaxID=51671 RepID=UPI002897ED44|nr:TRAM domain-containing protein [Microbacterium sp.]